MFKQSSKRIAIIFSVVALAVLATWGAFAATPSAITFTKSIVGGVTTAQPGDVITYRIGILNSGPNSVTLRMVDTLPAGVKLIRKPSRNVLTGSNPTNVTRDVRGKTVGYEADFEAGTGIEIFLPVRVGRCFDTSNKTIMNTATVSNPGGAGMQMDSASFMVDCSGTTTMSDLTWSAEFADEPTDDGSSRGWLEGVAAAKGRFVRMRFNNQGISPLTFKLKMPTDDFRVTLGWTGCLTCVRSAETSHVETVDSAEYDLTVMPNDNYYMEFYAEPVKFEPVAGDMVPFDVAVCLPDFDDGGCDTDNGAGDNGQPKALALLFFLSLRDYGDAPDRTNHFGAAGQMNAYPGVPANFPTVHDAAAGLVQGPGHLNSGNFHLGNGVSAEFLADMGPDFDPANNIEPVANVADLDDADDGTQLSSWVLTDCMTTTIPVRVFISPATVAVAGVNPGYVNIWADRNRDGDWADSVPCGPNPADTAYEHIVIDAPVDIATLGAGLHTINVPTGLVPPTPGGQPAGNPYWARVMLTGVPSEKLAGQPNGDGRGRTTFYASGETEDYLLNNPQPFNIGVDGSWGGDTPNGDVGINWRVRFGNQGEQDQSNFSLDIDVPNQTVVQVQPSNDALSCVQDASGIVCTAPNLPAGARGTILLRTILTTNENVMLTATADSDDAAPATETQTLRGARGTMQIMEPRNGTISAETDLHVRGQINGADGGTRAPLQVYWDDTLIDIIIADAGGAFELTAPITATLKTPGQHTLRVVSSDGNVEASRSLVVDGIVGFDAASIKLVDSVTDVEFAAFGENGRQDTDGFRIIMQGNVPLTMSVRSEAVSMRIRYEDGTVVPMVIPEGEPCVFTVQIAPPTSRMATAQKFFIEAIDADGNMTVGEGTLIQAAKALTVVDASNGSLMLTRPLTEALRIGNPDWTATDWRSIGPDTLGNASSWIKPCPSHVTGGGPCPAQLTTDSNGQAPAYPREVEQGFLLEVAGFQSMLSAPKLGWTGCLTCVRGTTDAPSTTIAIAPVPAARATTIDVIIDGNSFAPAYLEVFPGTVINFKNVDSNDHGSMSDSVTFANDGYGVGAWDSGVLAAGEAFAWTMDTVGTFTYVDPQNPLNTGTIVVTNTPTAVTLSGGLGTESGNVGTALMLVVSLLLLSTAIVRTKRD